jgi:hypothetical protein
MICFVSPEEKELLFFFYIEHHLQSIAAQGFQNRFGKQNPDFCQELIFRSKGKVGRLRFMAHLPSWHTSGIRVRVLSIVK